MKKIELAKALNISTRCLRKYVARGMPTCSLKAALKWRACILDLRQTKSVRMCGNDGGSKSKKCNLEVKPSLDGNKNSKHKRILTGSKKVIFVDLSSNDIETVFKSARALKEKSLARRAKIEVDILNGVLIKKDEVEHIVFNTFRFLREQLLSLPKHISY